MAASDGGHKGGLELSRFIRLIQRTAYRQVHVAYNRVGVQKGLPPNVATVMVGQPNDGFWWNLKVGMMPEHVVRKKAEQVDDTDALEIMHKYGMHPVGKMAKMGITKYEGGKSMLNEHAFKRTLHPKMLYEGWRGALKSMLESHVLRRSQAAEDLLGRRDYRQALQKRLMNANVHYDFEF